MLMGKFDYQSAFFILTYLNELLIKKRPDCQGVFYVILK